MSSPLQPRQGLTFGLSQVRLELENCEDLSGTQESKLVLEAARTHLWFATKELLRDKQLKDFLGKNEKTKVTF